ncbi:MAG: hypothetical protein C0391_07720 [Anaerolinea sp.]|nr:hypothetical protein [Anaerolinea sp.]
MPISDLLPWNQEKGRYGFQYGEDPRMVDLRNKLNAVFKNFFAFPFSLAQLQQMMETAEDFNPGMDVIATEKEIIITADLPGMDEKDIRLAIEGQIFTLSGTRQQELERKNATVHRVERRCGSFQRSILLPCEVDINKAEATFSNGVLKVVIPKPSRARSAVKRIPIKNG